MQDVCRRLDFGLRVGGRVRRGMRWLQRATISGLLAHSTGLQAHTAGGRTGARAIHGACMQARMHACAQQQLPSPSPLPSCTPPPPWLLGLAAAPAVQQGGDPAGCGLTHELFGAQAASKIIVGATCLLGPQDRH
mmetsp:Transcript_32054/g.81477  ORF Transcript_32054/g.81477 Transcript_32054/m.81477 type:complete len:135 (-) Transcript_32054:360-764(-)